MSQVETLEEEEEKKNNKVKGFLIALFILVLLFFATFGITLSYYKGKKPDDNQIITDKIIFNYSDVNGGGRGINITNAAPITDAQGKKLIGTNEYFDFSITATSKNTNVLYKILIDKDETSTLDNSSVRIYLTRTSGNYESDVVLTDFSSLKQEKINDKNYYVLYEKTLNKGIENYSEAYRLRMWVKENTLDSDSKKFALKVDVHAVQVGDDNEK